VIEGAFTDSLPSGSIIDLIRLVLQAFLDYGRSCMIQVLAFGSFATTRPLSTT